MIFEREDFHLSLFEFSFSVCIRRANMSNVNADAAAVAAVAAVAACNPDVAGRLYAWQWPDGTDPALATKLNAILVQQLGVSNFFVAPHGQKGRMEREYADVLIASGELSRPGYRSPAQSGIIAKITKLDLFCRAIIKHRQEHVEKGKVAQRKKEVDKQEGEQHRQQAFQTFKGNQQVFIVDGDERGSTSKYQAKGNGTKRQLIKRHKAHSAQV
jgi:hypothetical protein